MPRVLSTQALAKLGACYEDGMEVALPVEVPKREEELLTQINSSLARLQHAVESQPKPESMAGILSEIARLNSNISQLATKPKPIPYRIRVLSREADGTIETCDIIPMGS